ncbi:zinc-binding alcohol dehydrogenase family protein [Pectobacterium aroidearum]|uniref:Zinc-binding alcohol dehydrogenase family protein n=1 Tax=Pectobacterium aroidearum TaxID=1201031 RepID=A0AAW3SZX1_9GAMM|nr:MULTISPECIES: zinc-binding alcohol dehydrogenase family protein [Pectobacterium]MBA5201276.1 zinc-binding alcohol dehydrogenase family protein [Pectobacterium aroidearum]MBA5205284.1 zinc-binding alcohol dehydrogenase family protein [Pectobacterium aroidearum]MBA5229696.1 zinc-binding alcohol dehydrogenase family protein [Pectobacterium aroidearum]MBA5234068.1 zinc-binding alcohol dehydrogenase family protein [Pectobacterium aroidearum]MBA5739058.1 zinc-binding alcohol dehydrogenase family 
MSTMNTLICQEPKKLVWKKREIPIPGEGETLIKIKSVGICGTDIHAWGGNQPFFSYPRVLGHEICGEVVDTGKNVHQFKKGQQVAVIPYVACQQCPACKSGRTNCCEKISVIGVHQDGGFSEYLAVPATNVLLAEGIDPQAAALIEPYAISAHAVRRAKVLQGEQVLVVGAGPIGLGAAAIAKADGAHVVVADTSAARREHVIAHLNLSVVDPSAEDFEAQLRAEFGGSLAEKVIDATGNQHAMNNTINLIRHGGSIVFVGLFKGDLQFSDPDFHKKETTMMGSRNATPEDFAKVGRLMSEGKLTAEMMLTHRYPFSTLADIYEKDVINNRELIKGVITF